MNWLIKIMGSWVTLVLVLAGAYALYRYQNPVAVARFALTVEVEADGKLVSGTSVMEGRFWKSNAPIGMPYGSTFEGEAVVVDLGPRGLLFATLWIAGPVRPILEGDELPSRGGVFMLPEIVFKRTHQIPRDQDVPVESDTRITQRLALEKLVGCADLEPKEWPLLVRFGDPKDPSTVKHVTPLDLAASFGTGVALKRMTICMSKSELTNDIDTRLPWLGDDIGKRLNSIKNPPNVPYRGVWQLITHGAFKDHRK